jgi:hypothetical protein
VLDWTNGKRNKVGTIDKLYYLYLQQFPEIWGIGSENFEGGQDGPELVSPVYQFPYIRGAIRIFAAQNEGNS